MSNCLELNNLFGLSAEITVRVSRLELAIIVILKKNDMKSLPASQYGNPSSRKKGLFPKSFPQ